jgi:hypothetical protein
LTTFYNNNNISRRICQIYFIFFSETDALKPPLVGLPVYKHAPRRLRKPPPRTRRPWPFCHKLCLNFTAARRMSGSKLCAARRKAYLAAGRPKRPVLGHGFPLALGATGRRVTTKRCPATGRRTRASYRAGGGHGALKARPQKPHAVCPGRSFAQPAVKHIWPPTGPQRQSWGKMPAGNTCLKHPLGGLSAGQAPCGARHFPPDTPSSNYLGMGLRSNWGQLGGE